MTATSAKGQTMMTEAPKSLGSGGGGGRIRQQQQQQEQRHDNTGSDYDFFCRSMDLDDSNNPGNDDGGSSSSTENHVRSANMNRALDCIDEKKEGGGARICSGPTQQPQQQEPVMANSFDDSDGDHDLTHDAPAVVSLQQSTCVGRRTLEHADPNSVTISHVESDSFFARTMVPKVRDYNETKCEAPQQELRRRRPQQPPLSQPPPPPSSVPSNVSAPVGRAKEKSQKVVRKLQKEGSKMVASASTSVSASSAFFSRSVRSMVESGAATGMSLSRRRSSNSLDKEAGGSGSGSGIDASTAAAPPTANAVGRLPQPDVATPRDPDKALTEEQEMVTPKHGNRKMIGDGEHCDDSANTRLRLGAVDVSDGGDESICTPVIDRNQKNDAAAEQAPRTPPTFLFSSPERIRPIVRVASTATIGLKQSLHTAVTQSPAVRYGKRRGSEILQRRKAQRAAAIKRRLARIERLKAEGKYSPIIIPADHPVKIAWDILTIILTILSALRTHQSIRDRTYDQSPFVIFTEFWFILDIMLNFFCEHKTSSGEIIRDGKAVWARYLTTWFVIDALSVVPWERIYVKPIVEQQKRRNIFTKTFFRSKAVVRVTRILRGRHVKLFGRVAKQTKSVGVGGQRLLRLIIKYVPKYLLFYRNMRSVLVVRTLRQVHFLRKLWKSFVVSIRREPLGVLRRPGMVFAAASAELADDGGEDWDDDDFDDELDDDELNDINEADSNSLLDEGGKQFDEDELVDAVFLPDLDETPDRLPPRRDRAVSDAGPVMKNSTSVGSMSNDSHGSSGLRFRKTGSKEGVQLFL